MLAILAPVPAEILGDAFQVSNPEGIVAFGTGAASEGSSGAWSFEFFTKAEIESRKGELPVLIYGSATDVTGKHELHRRGYVTAIAMYQRIEPARAGRHPRPDFRPKSALVGDTAYTLFWEVTEIIRLLPDEQLPLNKLKLYGTGKLKPYSGAPPRGPLLVVTPDELIPARYNKQLQ